jgi:hypothetical protein
MPILPVRSLAERGLILDAPPFELGANAFSNGSNVRFRDGAVRRASVKRLVRSFAVPNVRAAMGYSQSTGFDRVFVGDDSGRIYEVNDDNTTTDRTVTGLTPVADGRPWTWTSLGDVLFVNKPTHVPAYFPGGAATRFVGLTGWPPNNRARALAAGRDQLFAVNLTKGVSAFPNLVAISDYAVYGAPPATWDPLAAMAANEITIAGARTPLVGCADLDGTMIVYGERQAWRFVFTGDTSDNGQNLWVNEPLSVDRGLIAPNAVTYLERKHYVFGTDDIYVHDGVSVASIANDKVRRWVFRSLDASKADRCFAAVDPVTDEVVFAFPSTDADAVFSVGSGCNRAAMFNPRTGAWTLIDLNDVVSADFSNFNPNLLWTGATTPWLTFGGSWADLGDGFARNLMLASPRGSTARIFALDEASTGRVSAPAPVEENPTAFVERIGIDLDEVGAPLNAYKVVSSIFPQIAVLASETPVRIRVGTALYPQGPYSWGPWKTFDPVTDYRVDFNKGGRYLGMRLEMQQPVDFEFPGFDVDVKPGGRR